MLYLAVLGSTLLYLACTWLYLHVPGLAWSVLKGLKMFGKIKPKCHRDWDGILPDRSISRSPIGIEHIGDNNDDDEGDDVNIQGGRTWSQTCDSSHQWLEHGKWLAFDSKDKNL